MYKNTLINIRGRIIHLILSLFIIMLSQFRGESANYTHSIKLIYMNNMKIVGYGFVNSTPLVGG
jgi:hypothetical protein